VARYGMPYAPPFSFLMLRYAGLGACFLLWIAASPAWPGRAPALQWLHLGVTGVLMHAATWAACGLRSRAAWVRACRR
jgi:drug/metabolite transporter (DMT)-like permease